MECDNCGRGWLPQSGCGDKWCSKCMEKEIKESLAIERKNAIQKLIDNASCEERQEIAKSIVSRIFSRGVSK